jgi:DNA-binding MarR family transcriptional regulator
MTTNIHIAAAFLRPASAMTDELGFADYSALAALHEQLQRAMESTAARTRQAGLEPLSFQLLLAIRRQPPANPITIGRLVEVLGWERATVVELLDGLVRRRFATRTRDKADRRRFLISLTPIGEEWLRPLAKDELHELVVSGADLLRSVRVAVSHAAASAARTQPPVRADVADFAWQAVGSAPI